MFRRSLLIVALAVVTLTGGQAFLGNAGAGVVNSPFIAVGTVYKTHVPLGGGTPVDGEVDSFVLRPVSSISGDNQQYLASDGSLQVYVTPSTSYYLKDSSGAYRHSDYQHVVVAGQDIKVSGDRFTRSDGTVRFVARFVYNPPAPPPPGDAYAVKCGSNNQRLNNFTTAATILQLGIHYPCTNFVNNPTGIRLYSFTDSPPYFVSLAIQDFGNRLEVTVTPATKYIKGRKASTSDQVLRTGTGVRVFGTYVRVTGGWIFEAKSVWTPDPVDPTATDQRIDSDISATQDLSSPGHYSGPVQGPNSSFVFRDGNFDSDLVWSATPTGFSVSGTWTLSKGADVLRGTLAGETSGINALDMSFSVTSGEGQLYGMTGGGDFEGSYTAGLPGNQPTAFTGHLVLHVVPNPPMS